MFYVWNKLGLFWIQKICNNNEIFENKFKINLKTIKYCLKYGQKNSNKLDTHKKSSNK